MITTQAMPKTTTRSIVAKVEHYNGSTLKNTFYYNDFLQSINVDRTCDESKLMGFIVSQKATIKIIDRNNKFSFAVGEYVKIYFDHGQGYICPMPNFYISEVSRDKVKKEVTITAYDLITYEGEKHTVSELTGTSYNIGNFLARCKTVLGAESSVYNNVPSSVETLFTYTYSEGANFDGSETIRSALAALAEATQTIIFIDYQNRLQMKRYRVSTVTNIKADEYFSFEQGENVKIGKFANITELGENIESSNSNEDGVTYYMRNNPFLELREDVATVLDEASAYWDAYRFNMFQLKTRGNYLLEIGDHFSVYYNNSFINVYLLNDSIKYDGGLSQTISRGYKDNEQVNSNPSTIGDMLKMTSAKVDKVNREIELLIIEEDIQDSKLASLQLTADNIVSRVESVEQSNEVTTDEINKIKKQVEASITSEDVTIAINQALDNGVDKVETSTGYKFNADGLTVSKSGSEMKTTITEDGMTVYKNNADVLTANHEGVKAVDLHAKTFLIIGKNSRLEDFGTGRTACFYIG